MSLEAAKANGLQLKYIFLAFLPNPITWQHQFQSPYVAESDAFYSSTPAGNPSFLIGPFQSVGAELKDVRIQFERRPVLGFERWKVRPGTNPPGLLLKYAEKMCHQGSMTYKEFPSGTPLT